MLAGFSSMVATIYPSIFYETRCIPTASQQGQPHRHSRAWTGKNHVCGAVASFTKEVLLTF
jgi:hypothetical protein